MKRLRKNSGFTLVECIVAMAVLAVMTLGLLMILSVAVRQRNQNTDLERNIDKQVENLNGTATVTAAAEDIVMIDGDNSEKISVNKVYFDDPKGDVEVGKLQLGATTVTTTPAVTTSPQQTTKPEEVPMNTPSTMYKVYGAIELTDSKIYISEQSATDNENGTHTVTWRVKFNVDTNNLAPDIKTLKVVFPSNSKVVAYGVASGTCQCVHRLGSNVVRFDPGWVNSSSIEVDIEFIIPSSSYSNKLITEHFGSTTPEMHKF